MGRKGFRPKGGFVKVLKNNAYFSRYQVKYRRRREGKTDYRARRFLVNQDKTKYNAPKHRLIARITNKDVIAQLAIATLKGDKIISAAYSHELPKYGVKLGLTNYAACYATGLLLARRALKSLSSKNHDLFGKFKGQENVDGKHYLNEDDGVFTAFLDVGLARTTTGARVFGVLKGVADGGVHVPHNTTRFPGSKGGKYNADKHRERIFGAHVAGYIADFQKQIAEKEKAKDVEAVTKLKAKYDRQFGRFIKANLTKAADIEAVYKAAHAAIRKDPTHTKKARPTDKKWKVHRGTAPKSYADRKNHQRNKVAALRKSLGLE